MFKFEYRCSPRILASAVEHPLDNGFLQDGDIALPADLLGIEIFSVVTQQEKISPGGADQIVMHLPERGIFKGDKRTQTRELFVVGVKMGDGKTHQRDLPSETLCAAPGEILHAHRVGPAAEDAVHTAVQTALLVRERQQKTDQRRQNKQNRIPQGNTEFDRSEKAVFIP